MRRNRVKWIKVADAETAGNGFTVNAPTVYRRILAVTIEVSGASAGEATIVRFLQRDGNVNATILEVMAGNPGANSVTRAAFTLQGVAAVDGVASGYTTGPLPDIWFGPDLPVSIKPDCFSGAGFTNMRVLLEECDLSEG